MTENNQRILGVKAIASHLGVSIRTVYRWEKTLGLPLHRLGEKTGYTVFAYSYELETWLAKSQSKNKSVIDSKDTPKGNKKKFLIIIFILVAAIFFIFFFNSLNLKSPSRKQDSRNYQAKVLEKSENTTPHSIIVEKGIAYSLSKSGEKKFHFRVSNGVVGEHQLSRMISQLNIDGDEYLEIAARTYDQSQDRYYLALMDHDGTVIWRTSVSSKQTFAKVTINDKYYCDHVKFVTSLKGKILIIAGWRHRTRFLSIISCHDLEGNLIHQYLNTGHLLDLVLQDLDLDGEKEIIFSGTNNLLNGEGIMAVLTLKGFFGVGPPYKVEPEHQNVLGDLSKYVPDTPVKGNQIAYLRFCRINYFKENQNNFYFPHILDYGQNNLTIELHFHQDTITCTLRPVYIFDTNMNLVDVFPSPYMKNKYPIWLTTKKINISLQQLTDVFRESVLRWHNGRWETVPFLPRK